MPVRVSDLLSVTHEQLDKIGCFDAFLDIDAKLYVSPKLLQKSTATDLKGCRAAVLDHYRILIKLIKQIQRLGDVFWKEAHRKLHFKEIPNLALGHSKSGVSGRGIGPVMASKILSGATDIVRAGIEDPEIFELIGIFQEGIGADRISDMIIKLIYFPFLLRYTESVSKLLKVKTQEVKIRGQKFDIPVNTKNKKPIVLLPKDILARLPIAIDRSEISDVCHHNDQLRSYINKKIGLLWHKEILEISKSKLLKICLDEPKILSEILAKYKTSNSSSYDFKRDKANFFRWYERSKALAQKYPLTASSTSSLEFSKTVCTHYKDLIEKNALFNLLYDKNGKLQNEKHAQLLFLGIADVYCRHFDFALSREPNAGRGPVDFTISRGYKNKICLEFKYSSNPKLVSGYQTQLSIYEAAENSIVGIYVVIQVDDDQSAINRLLDFHKNNTNKQREIVLIDGRRKKSASKAKSIF